PPVAKSGPDPWSKVAISASRAASPSAVREPSRNIRSSGSSSSIPDQDTGRRGGERTPSLGLILSPSPGPELLESRLGRLGARRREEVAEHVLGTRAAPSGCFILRLWPTGSPAHARRHRRAQGGPPMRRSIRPTRARCGILT